MFGMLAVGHCHPAVVKAIQDQAAKYIHPGALVTTAPKIRALLIRTVSVLSRAWATGGPRAGHRGPVPRDCADPEGRIVR